MQVDNTTIPNEDCKLFTKKKQGPLSIAIVGRPNWANKAHSCWIGAREVAAGIWNTSNHLTRPPLETYMIMDGRATLMVGEELEEVLACTVSKYDMTELSHCVFIHTRPSHKQSCQSLHSRNGRIFGM